MTTEPSSPEKPLTTIYHDWVSASISEEGISLPQALSLEKNGALTVFALAVEVEQAYRLMARHWAVERPRELIFAFDRFTKPGQGTTLGDVMAGWFFGQNGFLPFVIEYQHHPRIVKPIVWNNAFWNAALMRELKAVAGVVGS